MVLQIGSTILRRTHSLSKPRAWAGFFLGLGAFHLFDGIVDHKVLRLHQIRYVDNLLPYDITWNAAGLVILLIGFYLLRKAREKEKKGIPASANL